MFYTVFKNCSDAMQGNLVSDCNNMYPYRGIMPLVLSTGEGAKTSTLTSKLYYKDQTAENFTATNPGFVARRKIAARSKFFDCIGKIASPLFEKDRWLIPGLTVDVKLTKNYPEFCLDSNSTGTSTPYNFEKCTLYEKAHSVNAKIVQKHKALLSKESGLRTFYVTWK
jgi:hypothetical protein